MSELNRAWSLVFEEGAKTTKWYEVSGPASAPYLSLKRLKWTMPNCATIRDHDGVDILLTFVSPTLLKDLARK
eukprot:556761-Pyramimonas_sp.AAC.1